jgi:steroid 5-alpha reductase family enzyme
MHSVSIVLIGYLSAVLIFSLAWLWQLRTRNAGMVDPIWSYSVGALAVLYAVLANGEPTVRVMTALLGGGWGLRLGSHLLRRNMGEEDGRYARLREEWGPAAQRNMFWFFQLQVVFAMLLSLGFLVVVYQPLRPSNAVYLLALVVWLISVAGEGCADRQLSRFKAAPENRGKVCRRGLWRYSRHPNYFFECLHWLTYAILALASPWLWVTLIPPLVMAWLLLKVSGIPLTEAQTARSRPDYAEYIRTTSALIPWPPKKVR